MEKVYRSGIGFDVHKLVEGRKCIIGGVDIPYEKGLLGHSDADVLLHAISDALLGAAGLGDIGTYFPDTDPAFKGADSLELLRKVGEEVRKAGENRVWLIPYNKKFYDLKGCYDKWGEVYWTQHFHFQAGDTGYIYGAAPESSIRFSFRVKEADLPYSQAMDNDNEFVKGGGPLNSDESNKLYAHMILTGETNSKRLSLANLIDRGLKGAPMGAMNLSKKELKELLSYIEENF